MIGPGSLPRWRPAFRRTLTYTRRRRMKARARNSRARGVRHDESVLYDPRASELPTAVLMPKSRGLAVLGGLQRWLIARWSWFVPRAVPVMVAAIGMILVLISADYLAHSYGVP